MCTLILLRRPGHRWPILAAGNRDERADRPWQAPARHWPDRPDVVGGLDELAGGTWMGINDNGVMAAVLNRQHSLGPAAGKRSRGELVLDALEYADAADAAEALDALNGSAYRPFNLVVADNRDAFFIRHSGVSGERIGVHSIAAGLTILTGLEPNDPADPRIARHLPLFRAAAVPDPDTGDWQGWAHLLQTRGPEPTSEAGGALTFMTPSGFGTVSASLVALPSVEQTGVKPVWLFSDGPADQAPFRAVTAFDG